MIEFRPFLAEPLANGSFTVNLAELHTRLLRQYRAVSGHFPPVVHIRSGAYLNAEATLHYIREAYEDYNRRSIAHDPKMGTLLGGRGHRLIQQAVEEAHQAEQSLPELPLKALWRLYEAGVKAAREIRFSGGLPFPVEAVLAGDERIPETMIDELHLDEAAIAVENFQKQTPDRFLETARDTLGQDSPRLPVMEAASRMEQQLRSGKGYEDPDVLENGRAMRNNAARAAQAEGRQGPPMAVDQAQVMIPQFAQEGLAQESGRRHQPQQGRGGESAPPRRDGGQHAEGPDPNARNPRRNQPAVEAEPPADQPRKGDAKGQPAPKGGDGKESKDAKAPDPKQLQGKIQEAAQALAKAGVQAVAGEAPKAPAPTPQTPQVQPDRGPQGR